VTDRKKPTAGIWITVALVAVLVLVVYPLSAGPGLWIAHHDIPSWCLDVICFVYAPVTWAEGHAPEPVVRAICAYLEWWIPKK
jgi:hypothetical protein